ncbi:MAG: bifunctional folylpolyglutamate synthase/dihydrofolate synthase, partial [Clostridia bacterium]|nr:bifunctional folylpolyglutamate synthase/dihydrofolate synthase [Clostridia bacterium]
MNYREALKVIHQKGNFNLPAGLDRIKNLLNVLGNPQNKFKAIHIAGTNGKGSTAAMTAEVLEKAGYKTGLFTSPYIVEFRDRIRINGEFIPETTLARLTERVAETNITVSEFEMITAIGFLYFAEENCDVAVIETGLGGRFDATNTMDNVLVSVITKIGLDHTAILGDTIKQIAKEKCGIIKNSITVTVPNQPDEAIKVIAESSDNLTVPDISKLQVINSGLSGNEFIYKGNRYITGLAGAFQIDNALTVIEAIKKSGLSVSQQNLFDGIKSAHFPARLEVFYNGKVVLDGAHNPDGANVLANEMKYYSGEVTAIIGMMKDKDFESVLKSTLPYCKKVIAVTVPDMPRALNAEELACYAKKYCKDVICADSYKRALNIALISKSDAPVFVFGSL